MKIKSIISILIIIVLLSIFSGCSANKEDVLNENSQAENKQVDNILVKTGMYEYSYYESVLGKEIKYTKETEEAYLPVVLNNWISDLIKQNVNYGKTSKGNSILEDLEVKAAYFKDDIIIIVMNEAFMNFDKGYSKPIYFLDGVKNILRQVTEASEFSIEVEGYTNDIIHPDGVSIKNIPIKE